jgi:hypothetical protein
LATRGRSPNIQFNVYGERSVSISEVKGKYKGKDVNWDAEIGKMTPRSQNQAKDYIEKVLKPKTAYTEETLD